MSRPKFDPAETQAALGAGRAPLSHTREGRVVLLGNAGRKLLRNLPLTDEERMLLGGGLVGWLDNGGDLARDYLKVVKPKSHRTPTVIWRERTRHPDDGVGDDSSVTSGPDMPTKEK